MARKAITQAMRQEVARRVGGRPGEITTTGCAYCNSSLIRVDWIDPDRVRFLDSRFRPWPELDHMVSVHDGGPHTVENLVPVCLSCNRSKCHLTIAEWASKRLANARQIAGPSQLHVYAPSTQYPVPRNYNSFRNVGEEQE